jgi:hypothetical protein
MPVTIVRSVASTTPYTPKLKAHKEVWRVISDKLQDLKDNKTTKDKVVAYLTGLSKFDRQGGNARIIAEWDILINHVRNQ